MIEPVGPGRSGGSGGAIVILSAIAVVRDGVIGLLPDSWRARAEAVANHQELFGRLVPGVASVVIDGDTPQAAAALTAAADHGATTVLILGSVPAAPETLELPDAILLRDELEATALRLALAVGRSGVRIVPRAFQIAASPSTVPAGTVLSESARQILDLLAEGMRDAEIALALNISESAVRKHVQRTVQSLGARTRYQAMAIIARDEG